MIGGEEFVRMEVRMREWSGVVWCGEATDGEMEDPIQVFFSFFFLPFFLFFFFFFFLL